MHAEIRWAVRHVLASRARRRFLLADGIRTPVALVRFFRRVVPLASQELQRIRSLASAIPDDALRREAMASTATKAYHVAGACIFATFLPPAAARRYVKLVTPLESIYDYLDNLCDRHPNVAAEAYPVLHQAIADALEPSAAPRDYYAAGPAGDDGGYLAGLVRSVRESLRAVDGYEALLPALRESAALYAEMQTYKHYPAERRERACIEWFERRRDERFAEMTWYEFACAAGSQLQVYAPLFEACAGRHDAAIRAYDAYFPAIASLHVLLDSYVDQAEDREHGELNFATLYRTGANFGGRILQLAKRGFRDCAALPDDAQHRFVLRTMMLFYLTHPNVYAQAFDRQAEALIRSF